MLGLQGRCIHRPSAFRYHGNLCPSLVVVWLVAAPPPHTNQEFL
jgi:hypothetical protein